jgi:hypothetical protein
MEKRYKQFTIAYSQTTIVSTISKPSMTTYTTLGKLHWNYFLALEQDLETVSRYVEFCEPNFAVFSIELAHLLFASASEIDVIAKLLCELIDPEASRNNINEYKSVLTRNIPNLPGTVVFIPRYELSFRPWSRWSDGEESQNPIWWRSYNNVKHERDSHFNKATLQNVLNSMGALLILNFEYYSRKLALPPNSFQGPKDITYQLQPESKLIRLPDDFYYQNVIT